MESGDHAPLAVHGEDLGFYYDSRTKEMILDNLNISVPNGVIYGLLGPSGCGKTTLLRCIVGRLKPKEGRIKVYGKYPCQKGFCIPGPGVGFMPQELALYPEITAEETLVYFGRLFQMSSQEIKDRIDFLTTFLDIPFHKRLTKNLSGGQQRRLSFAAALIHQPPLLILDEPTVGVDPLLRQNIWNHLKKIALQEHTTIIITTHYVEEARQAHMVGFMREGHLLAESNPEVLIKRQGVNTLEEVFLKLCIQRLLDKTEIQTETPEKNGTSSDIWIAREDKNANGKTDQETLSILGKGKKREAISMRAISEDGERGELSLLAENHRINVIKKKTKMFSLRATLNRISALTEKNFIRLRRNIPLLTFQIILPAVQTGLFFLCMGGEPFDVPVAVVNMEDDPFGMSSNFLNRIDNHTVKQNHFSNLTVALDSVRKRENWGVIYMGEFFTNSLIERYMQGLYADNETIHNSTIHLYLDMTNKVVSTAIVQTLVRSFQEFAEDMLIQSYNDPVFATPPLLVDKPIFGDDRANFTEFLLPGMIVGIMFFMSVGLTTLSILNEKKDGLLDRSWIAGVNTVEMMFSLFILLFFVMIIQLILEFVLVFLIFKFVIHGPFIWVLLGVLISGIGGMSFGLFISSISNSMDMAIMIALGSFLPNILLSALMWPLEAMPYYLRYTSYCLPLTLLTIALRCIISRGWTITDGYIWSSYLISCGWIFIFIMLACFAFRKLK